MSTNTIPSAGAARGLGTGRWRLDPARSSVEFHVRHFYGLMRVGHFDGTPSWWVVLGLLGC
jgi:polyisoprenoid-binding protein YceI